MALALRAEEPRALRRRHSIRNASDHNPLPSWERVEARSEPGEGADASTRAATSTRRLRQRADSADERNGRSLLRLAPLTRPLFREGRGEKRLAPIAA